MEKTCSKCGQRQDASEFRPRSLVCKACISIYNRRWNAANREHRSVANRAYYEANGDLIRERHRQRNSAPADRHRQSLAAHGITPADYDAVLDAQGGGCAICGTNDPAPRRVFVVDHDHDHCSGPKGCPDCIRGLLCLVCNLRLRTMTGAHPLAARATAYLATPPARAELQRTSRGMS